MQGKATVGTILLLGLRLASAQVPSVTVLHVTFVGQGTSSETYFPNVPTISHMAQANLSWRARWDVMLSSAPYPTGVQGSGYPYAAALPGTLVTGKTTVMSHGATVCKDRPPVINTFSDYVAQPLMTPYIGIGEIDGNTLSMYVEAYGGNDFRLCDGFSFPASGDYGPPEAGYPGYDLPTYIVKFPIQVDDWVGQGEKKMTIAVGKGNGDGQGEYSFTDLDSDGNIQWSGMAEWSGTIILSTEPCTGRSTEQGVIQMTGLGCPSTGPAQTFTPVWGPFGARPKLGSTKTGTLELKCDARGNNGEYQFLLNYTPPGGDPRSVGACVWPNGCNSAWFGWEGGGTDASGAEVPMCIDETHWTSKDYGNNTLRPDGTSLYTGEPENPPVLDWVLFDYDVFTDELMATDKAFAYALPGQPPTLLCGNPLLNFLPPEGALQFTDLLFDPPLGDATEAFFATTLDGLSQFPGVSAGSPYSPADFSLSGTPDMSSAAVFQSSLGQCIPEAQYNGFADLDNDGCVTLKDYQIWFRMYQPQSGDGTGNETAVMHISAPGSVNPGDTFAVTLSADISDPVVGWGAALAYDSQALQLNSVIEDPAWLQGSGQVDGEITGIAFPTTVSGNGTVLATYSFTALNAGDTVLTLTMDPTRMMEAFPLAAGNFVGDYSVQTATVSIGSAAAAPAIARSPGMKPAARFTTPSSAGHR